MPATLRNITRTVDWSPLADCFPRGVVPGDIDGYGCVEHLAREDRVGYPWGVKGFVELGGNTFVLFEAKSPLEAPWGGAHRDSQFALVGMARAANTAPGAAVRYVVHHFLVHTSNNAVSGISYFAHWENGEVRHDDFANEHEFKTYLSALCGGRYHRG